MKPKFFLILVFYAFSSLFHVEADSEFVETRGVQLMLNGSPYYANGFNAYWLMYVASDPSQRNKVSSTFQEASNHGLNIAITWAFSDGGYKPLQYSPGSYNEDMFQKSPSSFQVPTFHNLTQMELFFNFFIFINYKIYRDWPHKWRWMLEVLRQSPKLQRLIIHEEEKEIENEFDEENWEDPQVVPECLSSQLKTCLFTNCRGRECQLQFVEYVMLNSKVLRTMTIHTASCIDLKTKYQILKKLAVCPRSCNLMFD
ncbi:F-box/FBD/LRR-repeat protein At3g51530-like [Cicer arietinum]|uniref:F-box/FBD/LRR-repeat protein At3g51530-like n=1 Tax=Cicer arietinum TaxID=3827 RepID=UPI003CC659EF